jgi:hypothetical protein
MDPDCSIPDIPKDILLPQEYVLTGYSRSLLRNPFNAYNQKKKMDASFYESKDHPENILELQTKGNHYLPIFSRNDRIDIDAQKVFKITLDFLEENGLSERLLKPDIDLDKILVLDQDNMTDNVEQTMVRFQEQDHQTLHDRFMNEVKNAINVPLSRPNTSGTLYRPVTASTRRSATPLKKARSVTSSYKSKKDDNDTVVESNTSRPQTGATLSNLQKGRKLTRKQPKQVSEIERAIIVVDFLQTSPLFAGYRSKGSKSLADWMMLKKTEDQIEDSDFSVQDFMRDYVKNQEQLYNSKPHHKGGKSLLHVEGTLHTI